MNRSIPNIVLASVVATSLGLVIGSISSPAFANFGQRHPRRAEVLHRDCNLNRQINGDRGHLDGQYGKLEREDATIRAQEQADARMNGGYITAGQQRQLNREENGLQRQIDRDTALSGGPGGHGRWGWFAAHHPRRAEVLGRDNTLNRELNTDRGHLDGQYTALKQDDRSIKQQEQANAAANGGFITHRQQRRLNQEENQLQNQINQDQQTRW